MQNKTLHTLNIERKNSNGKSRDVMYYIDDNGCYTCVSHKGNTKGYIAINEDNKRLLLHVHLYNLHVGEIPDGMIVMHKCDNPKCLNVEHYCVGTIGNNNQDMYDKGRRDQKNNVRLTIEQKIEMCKNEGNLSNAQIREKYGIGESTIKDIRKAFREGRLQ